MIDRFGPRPVMLSAIVLSSVGYMLFATVNSYATFLLIYLGVISLAFGAGFMHSPMVIANTWFVRRRAFAMTLISASISVGRTLISPLLASAVRVWGWRPAALAAGGGPLIVGIPLASFVRGPPASMALLPGGAPPRKQDGAAGGPGG